MTGTVHKLSAGDGYMYLMRQVAALDATERGYSSLQSYYSVKGESPGRWGGRGLETLGVSGQVTEQQMKNLFGSGLHPDAERIQQEAIAAGKTPAQALVASRLGNKFRVYEPENGWRDRLTQAYKLHNVAAGVRENERIPDEVRAQIRTELGTEMFIETHGRAHSDDRELTSFMARMGRPQGSAVAGFDLTFTPVKSVSTLWAVAPLELADRIELAHHRAVDAALEMLEREVAFTRAGRNGVAQLATKGLVYTRFFHRDSRAGDPNMHTHVPVSNKIQSLHDERWLALDARMLYRYGVQASETYNAALRDLLTADLGVTWSARDMGKGKQVVWEIAGVDPQLNDVFSSRRLAMEPVLAELTEVFRAEHGRQPTPVETVKLAQTANLQTRMAKHEPRSYAEQRTEWASRSVQVLGPAGVEAMISGLPQFTGYADVNDEQVTALAQKCLAAVTDRRAEFRATNLTAQVIRSVGVLNLHPDVSQQVIAEVVARALSPESAVKIEKAWTLPAAPEGLVRPDGESVMTTHGAQKFTTQQVLDAERRVLDTAARLDGRRVAAPMVDLAMLEWSANHGGATLNEGQKAMLRELCSNGKRINLAIAPAGTGKTTVMGVLARAHLMSGGNVVGLSPHAVPAEELAAALGQTADTVHKLIYCLQNEPETAWPQWMSDIDAESVIIVDEAGLAATAHLDELTDFVVGRGGSLVLLGDHRQRAASAAGGLLVDIGHAHGAVTLTEVMRFNDPVQGKASLGLRVGDPVALAYYLDQGWLHAVNEDDAIDRVYQGWSADIAAGRDSIMIVPTLADMQQLNWRARADRLAAAGGPVGVELAMPTGETVSAGDVVVTKRNNRMVRLGGGGDWVKNGHRFRVDRVTANGDLEVTHLTRGVSAVLPASYIADQHVRLGYAHTAASVQGLTVGKPHRIEGTAHTLVRDGMSVNELYVSMSRAVSQNHAYSQLHGTGADDHNLIRPESVRPEDIIEFLTTVLGTDGSSRSVTTEMREDADPKLQLGFTADGYRYAIIAAALHALGPDRIRELTEQAEQAVPGVTEAGAWDTLLGHLCTLELMGEDSIEILKETADSRELGTARDIAAVLDYRIDPEGNHSLGTGPLPWLPDIPEPLRENPEWNTYMSAAADQISQLAALVRVEADTWTVDTAPDWAVPYLSQRALVRDLAVWRGCDSVGENDLRPAGPTPTSNILKRWHAALTERAERHIGAGHRYTWQAEVESAGVRLDFADDYWPVLRGKVNSAADAGIDVVSLIIQAVARGPLPVEKPAATLWWRLISDAGFAAATRDRAQVSATAIEPSWVERLRVALGGEATEQIMADKLWPLIRSRITRAVHDLADRPTAPANPPTTGRDDQPDRSETAARPGQVDQDRLLADVAALSQSHPGHAADLAVLALRAVDILTNRDVIEHADDVDMLPPDPAEDDRIAPQDLHQHSPGGASDGVENAPAVHTADDYLHADEPTAGEMPAEEDLYVDPAQLWTEERARLALQDTADALTAAAQFYTQQADTSWVPAYLRRRGLKTSIAGYAPATPGNWAHLVTHLQEAGFSAETILASGLAKHNKHGKLMDTFRNRAVLPIISPTGQVVSFMGRAEEGTVDEYNPKYMNTPNTELFTKSTMVYGLSADVVQALKDGADVVFVEGPMDAAAINQARPGRIVAVSTNGTAFTPGHLAQIEQIAPLAQRQVLLALDADKAGQAASVRGYHHLITAGVTNPATITMPAGTDPAQLLQDHGPQTVRELFDHRTPLVDLVITQLAAATPQPGETEDRTKARAAQRVVEVLAGLPIEEQVRLTEQAAQLLDMDPFDLMDDIERQIAENDYQRHHTPDSRATTRVDDLARRSKELTAKAETLRAKTQAAAKAARERAAATPQTGKPTRTRRREPGTIPRNTPPKPQQTPRREDPQHQHDQPHRPDGPDLHR